MSRPVGPNVGAPRGAGAGRRKASVTLARASRQATTTELSSGAGAPAARNATSGEPRRPRRLKRRLAGCVGDEYLRRTGGACAWGPCASRERRGSETIGAATAGGGDAAAGGGGGRGGSWVRRVPATAASGRGIVVVNGLGTAGLFLGALVKIIVVPSKALGARGALAAALRTFAVTEVEVPVASAPTSLYIATRTAPEDLVQGKGVADGSLQICEECRSIYRKCTRTFQFVFPSPYQVKCCSIV